MSEQTVAASDTEFTITRTFEAPIATVWDTWTRPDHFEQWFHAKPGSVQLDVRPGGRWKAALDINGNEIVMAGVYREVISGEKIVWTLEGPEP